MKTVGNRRREEQCSPTTVTSRIKILWGTEIELHP